MGRLKQALICVIGLALVGTFLSAQVSTGKILGAITDEQGTRLPGVTVEATSPKLVGKGTAISDESGVYRIFALTPGTYRVNFTVQGFKPLVREGITVRLEQTIVLDVILPLSELSEEVTVVGQAPLIDVKTTAKGMMLTEEMFQVLPKGRDFDSLVTVVPGVINEPMLRVVPIEGPHSAASGAEKAFYAGISVDGASVSENAIFVDGTEISTMFMSTRFLDVAYDFVDEVQFKASGYEAEYGGSLGGVVNVITRQGGNTFHGEVIGYYSGSRLAGKERDTLRLSLYDSAIAEYVNYQDLYGKDRVNRLEIGFSLGGYILKDRLWFHASLLPVFKSTNRQVTFYPSNFEGNYNRKDTFWNFQGKLTAQPFSFMRLGISFVNNFDKYRGALPSRAGTDDPLDVWPDYGYDNQDWIASAYADFTFSNDLLLSLRGGTYYTDFPSRQLVQPEEPRYFHGGTGNSVYPEIPADLIRPINWANMTSLALWVDERAIGVKSYINLDLTYFFRLAGEHAWKAGFQWMRNYTDCAGGHKYPDYPDISLEWSRPLIIFGQNYGTGKYGYYGVTGNEVSGPFGQFFKVHFDRLAFYLQDSWTLAKKFTLNAGLRAEQEYLPMFTAEPAYAGVKPIDFGFGDKLAPRLGIIYDFFGDASLKFFANYGIHYDAIEVIIGIAGLGGYKYKTAFYTLDDYQWDQIGRNGDYPGTLLTVFDWNPVNPDIIDPDLKPMSQREISFGVEKKLGENLSAAVRVVQKHLRRTIENVGVLEPDGTLTYYFTNPGYGYSRSTANGGKFDPRFPEMQKAKREYWGVNFSLDKRFAHNWLAGFSYTWSRLTGNYSGLASSDQVYGLDANAIYPNWTSAFDQWFTTYTKGLDPIDGVLATDRPHFFKLYGAYTFPFRLTFGMVVNAMSGIPTTEYWNVGGGTVMPYNRGNLDRTPFLWFANLYAEYSLRFGKTSLAFNLNIDNIFDVRTAVQRYPWRTLYQLTPTQEQILTNSWELETSGYVPDARFNKDYAFYPPITARLGIKLIF
jgi:hypothetical protein